MAGIDAEPFLKHLEIYTEKARAVTPLPHGR
jgi:hypothetical protein